MRNIVKSLLLVIIFFNCTSCLVGRFVWYNFSNITDYKIFPSRPLPASPTPFHFIEAQHLSQKTFQHMKLQTLDSLLENTPTVAFLIIRNDSILFEKYYRAYEKNSTVASFSMAKSYTSALIGIAISEGHIHSVNDKIIAYIPEFKDKKDFDKVTIRHLLQMTSGIKANESYYSPFGMAAKIYYGRNLRKYISRLKMDYEPGTQFAYRSINTQLLGLILERATHKNVTEYMNEKLWQPIGMEYDATWSIDKKKNGLEKTFCCINAKARDFAKFGRLYLHKGNWNGKQLIPAKWVEESTQIDTTQGSVPYYQYQWWFTNTKKGNFEANGFHGQYIYVNPSKNLIIVRLGKQPGKNVRWEQVFEQLALKL
ncbi:serine hydrolase [Xanthocytophaga agilis]|uniref:Serine hydrolase n=1 Tax=Xanthocytophaga agilis TaxID=3048010 RepID=A0AAE3UCX4_9BACT|nr:serine hydrolase [Xanthocytophaga agilis]MDJ1499756.1 serine hydrolase [Xanthocytophaga agilis]